MRVALKKKEGKGERNRQIGGEERPLDGRLIFNWHRCGCRVRIERKGVDGVVDVAGALC